MERRYTLLDALGVRDIRAFNKKAKKERVQRLPYIVIVIDEFADLMATTGKELESTLARLAAMARAVGIHMVLATQRPSIDVITGLIKANIPSRIAFMVANKFDSRIIIDAVGAEKLLGKGDMLFSAAWNPFPVRIQGAYIDDEEIDAVTEYVKKLGPAPVHRGRGLLRRGGRRATSQGEPGNDPLFERALEIVMGAGQGVRLLPPAQAQGGLQPRRAPGGGDGDAGHRRARPRAASRAKSSMCPPSRGWQRPAAAPPRYSAELDGGSRRKPGA